MPEGIIRHEVKATGRLVTDCDRAWQAGRSFRHAGETLSSDIVHLQILACRLPRTHASARMDTCGGDEQGTQIVRAAQFNFDARPMWPAIHILPALLSSVLAYGPRRRPCGAEGHAGRSFAP